MNRLLPRVFIFLLIAVPLRMPATPVDVKNYSTPRGGGTEPIVNALNAAKSSILVMASTLDSVPIVTALHDAKKRGVDVQVILEKTKQRSKYPDVNPLVYASVPVFIDKSPGNDHQKIILVDAHIVILDSFNLAKAPEDNSYETLMIVDDAEMAGKYNKLWEKRKLDVVAYHGG